MGGAKGIDFLKKDLEMVFKASFWKVKGCLSVRKVAMDPRDRKCHSIW